MFKKHALIIDVNRNNDHGISCFKPGKPCADDLKMLEQQMAAFCISEQDQTSFDITDLDLDDANINYLKMKMILI